LLTLPTIGFDPFALARINNSLLKLGEQQVGSLKAAMGNFQVALGARGCRIVGEHEGVRSRGRQFGYFADGVGRSRNVSSAAPIRQN